MVYLWCTKCEKRYKQKKLNRKPYLSNILIFTNNSYNGLYRFPYEKTYLAESRRIPLQPTESEGSIAPDYNRLHTEKAIVIGIAENFNYL